MTDNINNPLLILGSGLILVAAWLAIGLYWLVRPVVRLVRRVH